MIKGNIEIKDLKTGEIYRQPMHSFVWNFLAGLYYTWLADAPDPVHKDTSGVTDNCQLGPVNALANNNHYGIVIGDGETAESCDQYALASKLNLTEEICQVGNVSVAAQVASLEVSRTFTNNTGGNKTINEIALIDSYGTDYFMDIRDKLASGVAINNGVSKNAKYTISVTDGLTKNFMLHLESVFKWANVTIKDTVGTDRTGQIVAPRIDAAEDTKDYGIVIGTDDTAIDIEDYQLGTQLTTDWKHFVTAGYLTERDTATGISKIGFSREFRNDTGSSVTVNEIGIVGDFSTRNFLFARYLTGGITVADGETMLIRLDFKTTM